jgi:two-component system, NtrC family, response regulator
LRERRGDVSLLTDCFIKEFSNKLLHPITTVAKEYKAILERQTWRGNIRELRNVIERSLIVCFDDILKAEDLPVDMQKENSSETVNHTFDLPSMERLHIMKVLAYTKGNKTETARLLKIGLTTLYRKIEEYGL